MTRQKNADSRLAQALRKIALQYPETEEGIACKGTALECSAFKARNKTFLFMSTAEVRVKLGDSLTEAAKLASKEPGRYEVGSLGWVKVSFSPHESPPLDLLQRWIDESYRLLVPKQLVALLPERGQPTAGSTRTAKQNDPGLDPHETPKNQLL